MTHIVQKAYALAITVSPIVGANYAVFSSYGPGYTIREFATDAVSGAFVGAVFGILSPVVAFGLPTYILLKAARPF